MKIPIEHSVEQAQMLIDALRHCKLLGMRALKADKGTLTVELPYSHEIVGNPETGVIHGGALSTLLDTCCGFSVSLAFDHLQLCPTMDLRIDYMRAAQPGKSIYAQAQVYRTTDNVVFSRATAYQDDQNKPVAHCVATFMRLSEPQITQTNKD